jgi:hypothetical protein
MEKLYVITTIYNPKGYQSRYKLYNDFKRYLSHFPNVVLVTVELAYGNQDFFVTEADDPNHIQLRGHQEFWCKENQINIAIKRLPPEAKNIAWVDADTIFLNPNWVQDTIDKLKTYKVVQMFSEYINLGPRNEFIGQKTPSFVAAWQHGEKFCDPQYESPIKGATGLAWAARKETLDQIGGLLDWMIVGSSDWYMAYALIGRIHETRTNEERIELQYMDDFQNLCDKYVNLSVGYVEGCAVHYWHGPKSKRGYGTRWKILFDNQFNPTTDLSYDAQGLYVVNPAKPLLLQQLSDYFASRDEDSKEHR